MLTPTPGTWTVRGASFAVWALVAASAVYWGLKLGEGGPAVHAPAPAPRAVAAVDPAAVARLLGSGPAAIAATAAAPSLASRFQLVGVVAGEASGAGAALISVDGKPARPYRVGSSIEEGVVLHSVRGRQAVLAQGTEQLTLELPRPAQAQVLPQAPGALGAPAIPVPSQVPTSRQSPPPIPIAPPAPIAPQVPTSPPIPTAPQVPASPQVPTAPQTPMAAPR